MKNLKLIFITALLMVIFCFKANSQNVAITDDATFLTPQSILHIKRNSDGSLLQLSNPTTTTAANRGLYFTATGNNFSLINNEAGSLSFHTTNLQRAIILSTGQFGINMTPTMQLDVTSATTTAGESAIRGASTGVGVALYGVRGTVASTTTDAAGVFGSTGGGQTYGVLGITTSTTGNASGIRGFAQGATGATNGVWGENASGTAGSAGVYGYESNTANGTSWGSGGPIAGVYGKAATSTSQFQAGVYGLQSGTGANSAGIVGAYSSTVYGGLGFSDASSNRIAVFANNNSGSGFGLLVNAGGTRLVPLASGVNGAILRTNASGDVSTTDFTGSTTQVLLGTGAFGTAVTSGTAWQILGNAGIDPVTNYIGTSDAQPFIIKTSAAERARVLSTGEIGIGTATPTASYLLTMLTNATIQNGLNMTLIGGSGMGININSASVNYNGILVSNSTASIASSVYNIGAVLSSTRIASGYLAYRTGGGNTYGLFGIHGTTALYDGTNANTWAAFIQGRAVISSESAPTSLLGTDLEIRNTTTGAAAPATLSMRQTTSLAGSGNILAIVNFGDNYVTTPQAQIKVLRDAAAGSSADMPTAITFSTTPDASAVLAERMRITNAGRVGIGTATPSAKSLLQVAGTTGGVLIPNMTRAQRVAIAPGATDYGLLVYQTDLFAGPPAEQIGFWYWDGAAWNMFLDNSPPNAGWLVLGNSGTVAGTNYIGTNDVQDFVIKTSAVINTPIERMRILSTGYVGINVAPSTSYQLYASSALATADNATIYGASTGAEKVYGVLGSSSSITTNASGVKGIASGASGSINGVWGYTPNSNSGTGVYGFGAFGVYGLSGFVGGVGVYGDANAGNTTGSGVEGYNTNVGAAAGFGGYFACNETGGTGVGGCLGATSFMATSGVSGTSVGIAGGDGVDGGTDVADGFGIGGWNSNASGTGIAAAGNNTSVGYLASGSGGAFSGTTKGIYSQQRTANASAPGTFYGNGSTYDGIYSFATVNPSGFGYFYHFGVHGELVNTGAAGNSGEYCGGVLGSYVQAGSGYCAGALGYHRFVDDGYYGGWFTTSLTNASGKTIHQDTSLRVGMGSFSSYLGANIQGGKYGIYTEGADFALYSHGNEYKDGLDIHIQKIGSENNALFTLVSNNVSIQTCGVGTLTNGESEIVLDINFMQIASTEVPMSINVTPMGECNGLYVQKTENGFMVKELNGGMSSVDFSYMVIAIRTGYENPTIANNYDELMNKLEGDINKDDLLMGNDNIVNNAATMTKINIVKEKNKSSMKKNVKIQKEEK